MAHEIVHGRKRVSGESVFSWRSCSRSGEDARSAFELKGSARAGAFDDGEVIAHGGFVVDEGRVEARAIEVKDKRTEDIERAGADRMVQFAAAFLAGGTGDNINGSF